MARRLTVAVNSKAAAAFEKVRLAVFEATPVDRRDQCSSGLVIHAALLLAWEYAKEGTLAPSLKAFFESKELGQ